ncbi:MAG: asparagine synthase-related protein [Candidatus Bathyarchaeia archaeon]|nr:hypothetical protein [Candidatus Bathyarchaeota archaeon]
MQNDLLIKKKIKKGALSGGLDTSILAVVASKYIRQKAFTCAFQRAPAPDIEHARIMAERLNLPHYMHLLTEEELYEAARFVIKTLQVFDPMEV